MEKCAICGTYPWNGLENHRCKPKWFCFDADEYQAGKMPTPDEFYSYGTSVFASTSEQAAIEFMRWREERYGDYLDDMQVLVLDKDESKVYKYFVEAETTRDYNTNSHPEIFELKLDDTEGNLKFDI
jgi:hypothetical protein